MNIKNFQMKDRLVLNGKNLKRNAKFSNVRANYSYRKIFLV